MRNLAQLLIATVIVITSFFACTKRENISSSNSSNQEKLRAMKDWLHENGGVYKNETIFLQNFDDSKLIGKLNWEQAKQYVSHEKSFISIPFEFDKGEKDAVNSNGSRVLFNLVIWASSNGTKVALRTTIKTESKYSTSKNSQIFCYYLFANDSIGGFWKGQYYDNLHIYAYEKISNINAISSLKVSSFFTSKTTNNTVNLYTAPVSVLANKKIGFQPSNKIANSSNPGWDNGGFSAGEAIVYSTSRRGYTFHIGGSGSGRPDDGVGEWQDVPPPDAGGEFVPTVVQDTVAIDTTVTKRYPCLDSAIKKIMGITNTDFLCYSIINRLFGESEWRTLNIKVLDIKDNNAATTQMGVTRNGANGYYGATIIFRKDYIDKATTIDVAATLFHEAIHAYLDNQFINILNFRMSYQDQQQQIESLVSQFQYLGLTGLTAGLDDVDVENRIILAYNNIANEAQHEAMGKAYIDIIVEALKDFDSNAHDDTFYSALAWGGLQKTDVWKKLPLQGIDTISIKNTLYHEQKGDSLALGKKCGQ